MRLDPFLLPALHGEFRRHPLSIHDVGAAGEIYPLYSAYPADCWRADGFEPAPSSFEKLAIRYAGSPNVKLHNVALGDRQGSTTFYVHRTVPTYSSLNRNSLASEDPHGGFDEIQVRCERLDDMLRADAVSAPDFIKLDTEGSELLVLRGGYDAIRQHGLAVVSEVKFLPFATTTTQFSDLDQHLRSLGFILFDIQTARMSRTVDSRFGGKKGAIDSAYVLYLRDFYQLYSGPLGGNLAEARIKLLKLLSLTVRYLYLDYAVELVDFGRKENLLDAAEAAQLLRLYSGTTDAAWQIPDFPGKAKLGLLVDYLSYLLHPEMKLAIPPMFNNFGNRRSALLRRRTPAEVRIQYPVRANSDRTALDLRIDIP